MKILWFKWRSKWAHGKDDWEFKFTLSNDDLKTTKDDLKEAWLEDLRVGLDDLDHYRGIDFEWVEKVPLEIMQSQFNDLKSSIDNKIFGINLLMKDINESYPETVDENYDEFVMKNLKLITDSPPDEVDKLITKLTDMEHFKKGNWLTDYYFETLDFTNGTDILFAYFILSKIDENLDENQSKDLIQSFITWVRESCPTTKISESDSDGNIVKEHGKFGWTIDELFEE